MPKPWEVVSSRVAYDNAPWLVVREEHVRLPNSVEIPDYVLALERDVAMVLAVTSDGQVPLVNQYKHGIGDLLWDLPAGYLDEGEIPLVAAQRELAEETGCIGGVWADVGELWITSNRGPQCLHLFVAQGVATNGERHMDATEEIDIQFVPLADMERLVVNGQIKGLSSVAGVLRGLVYLRNIE